MKRIGMNANYDYRDIELRLLPYIERGKILQDCFIWGELVSGIYLGHETEVNVDDLTDTDIKKLCWNLIISSPSLLPTNKVFEMCPREVMDNAVERGWV